MKHQDEIYLETEADAFFDRCIKDVNIENGGIRRTKKEIFSNIESILGDKLTGQMVLEIGCFIGDLMAYLRDNHKCIVTGIEPSAKACEFAKKNWNLAIENGIYTQSKFFKCESENKNKFDLIVIDDVLSWMPRETILPVLGSIDWMIKPGGLIYLRDFCPSIDFAYPNHHQKDKNVYNYKVCGGHKKFFLSTGNYIIQQEFVRNTNVHQEIMTARPDSMTWSDSILLKLESPCQPKIQLKEK